MDSETTTTESLVVVGLASAGGKVPFGGSKAIFHRVSFFHAWHSYSIRNFTNLAVLMNLLTLSSSDLLRYNGGSIGLTKYKDGSTGQSIAFSDMDDQALEVARNAGVYAFISAFLFLCLLTVHKFVARVPCSDILLTLLGAVIQLCLLSVYIAKDNSICELELCSWGTGATWLLLSQILMLSASIGSLYTSSRLPFFGGNEKKVCDN